MYILRDFKSDRRDMTDKSSRLDATDISAQG